MYKLTVVAGPNRGSSYAMQEGSETSIGRQTGNVIVLQSSKVSKKHCALAVSDGEVIVKDLGSSNGTFVNGALTKLRKLAPGDRVSVGEFVFELTKPVPRAPKPAPAVVGLGKVVQFPGVRMPSAAGGLPGVPMGAPGSAGLPGQAHATGPAAMPRDLKGKVIWAFEHRIMPIFYGMMLKQEWKIIAALMMGAFVLANLVVSVYPVLEQGKKAIVREAGKRARFMAKQIVEKNAAAIAARAETKTEIGSIEREEGVRVAVLTDLDNRILAPASKMGQYFTFGQEAEWAVRARDGFREGREHGLTAVIDGEIIVGIEPVKVLHPQLGRNVVVAMAIVSIDTALATPDLGEMGVAYSETLVITGIMAGIILLILYRLTVKPFEVLNDDIDKVLKGDMTQVTKEFKMPEFDSLWEIINSSLQRVPKGDSGGGGGGGFGGGGSASASDDYVNPLKTLGEIAKFGMVVCDAEKKIVFMNPMFEELTGIRADGAIGQDLPSVARDQSFAQLATDLLERAPVGGEGICEDFEFSGVAVKMYVGAFGGGPGHAKCYYLAAARAE